jgi:predicted Rossmann-fold nucleotide-binding protein
MHQKPLVMLDPLGHYDGLLAWLRGLVDTGYVGAGALGRLIVVADVQAAVEACAPSA